MKGFFLSFILLALIPSHAALSAETANTRTYDLPPAQAYDAVMATLGQLGMPIESSNPTGGHVKSSTASMGFITTLEVTNVYVQPSGDGSTVRIERTKGRLGKLKPANDPAVLGTFFSALDHHAASRTRPAL